MRAIRGLIGTGGGVMVGVLIGLHMRGAVAAGSAPCPTPTPTATATVVPGSHKIVLQKLWQGQSAKTTSVVQGPSFVLRGPFTFSARFTALDPSKVASGSASILNSVTSSFTSLDTVAIDVAGKSVLEQIRVTDNKCQFGCDLYVNDANNVKWTIEIEQ